jgi:putative transposase
MSGNPGRHRRRSIRLPGYDYSQNGAYFVTLCPQNRECLFWEITDGSMRLNETGRTAADSWEWLAPKYGYVVLDE